ncbi:peptide transporter mtd1 [Moniliophthora roreri]|nr:peptide transporter mtd1 [Moniliophthora roreri]
MNKVLHGYIEVQRSPMVVVPAAFNSVPFSTNLYGRTGTGLPTNQSMNMTPGTVNPGRPIANLYLSTWSYGVVSASIGLEDRAIPQSTSPGRKSFGSERHKRSEWTGCPELEWCCRYLVAAERIYDPYFVIPSGLVIGMVPTFIQWPISNRWPVITGVKAGSTILPIIWM